jgi:L-amino acid N-acyltransferase YncA
LSCHIREVQIADAEQIAEMYGYYVKNTTATFEIDPPAVQEIIRRIRQVQKSHTWLVADDRGVILGYAYGWMFKQRAAYVHSTEVTVYVDPHQCGTGIGSQLFERLIERLQSLGYVQAIGGIALPNPASVKLHEKFGFQKVAHFEKVGYKLGKWIDVGYWQKQMNPVSEIQKGIRLEGNEP